MKKSETGNPKYKREITQSKPGENQGVTIEVDVYDILRSFKVTDPELAHAAKKILCCGDRGHKDKRQDLIEIMQAIERAIEFSQVNNPAINLDEEGDEPTL